MSRIAFNAECWACVKDDARRWWAGQLERPLIHMTITGCEPGRPAPKLARVARDVTSYDLSVAPADIVDRWDYDLACCRFLGDGFPHVMTDFGPGVVAAFLGAKPEPGHGTVWFHPDGNKEIADFDFRLDPQNIWLQRIKAIGQAAVERWQGSVQVDMTDLGGNLDILSTFRPGEKLLFDLVDHPADVKRLTWQAHALWWQHFDAINQTLQPANPGYTAWTPIFSEVPYYMLQCDFCYMISPAMFDEFVKPELVATCRRLGNAFYHLDGPGQLPHLDSLLAIKELKGIQWVPGTGQPGPGSWPDVYRKIRRAGKLMQVVGDLESLAAVVEQVGSAEGIFFIGWADAAQADLVGRVLRRYGVPAGACRS